MLYWYQGINGENDDNLTLVKQRTDGKRILRQEKIKNLIESLSRPLETEDKNNDQKQNNEKRP